LLCIFRGETGTSGTHFVDKKHRRKGYGTLLMKEMEKFAKNKGMKIITLYTSPDNVEALIFLPKERI